MKMIWASAALHVGCLGAAAVTLLASGSAVGGSVLLLLALAVLLMWGCYRRQLELCGRLLSIAAHAVRASPALVWLSVGLCAAAGLILVTATGFGIAAYSNGRAVPNPLLTSAHSLVFLGRQCHGCGPL